MATYDDQLVVLVGGKLQKIGASDNLEISGSLTASGFSGSGASLTSIPQSAVVDLTSDLATIDGKADQGIADAAAAQATADAALPLAGGTLTGPVSGTSLSLSGDLVVQGDIVSKGQVNVLISDSFVDLNSGNTVSASATAGGLTINVKASGASETATAFVAGVVSTSAPSMTISGSAFVAGDIVQVSGSVDGKNDGLFVVAGVAGSVVSIKGVGGTAPAAYVPFVQTQFVAQSAQSAVVTKVDLAVFAVSNGSLASASGSIPTGTFAFDYQAAATEASFASSWIALNAVATPSLSDVLSVGSMIGADQEIGFTGAVASAAVKGDLLYVASDGEAKLLSSSIADGELDGVALEAGGAGKEIASLVGQKIWVGISGATPAVGDLLYVSSTAGKAAVAAPTSGRVLKVGKCVGAVGAGANSGLYPVLFQPQYIADI